MQPSFKPPPPKRAAVQTEDYLWALLREIQNHPALAEGAPGRQLSAELAALQTRFQEPDNAAGLVEAAVAMLKKHGAQTKVAMDLQKSEIAAATTQLSDVMKALPSAQSFEERLSVIEQQIESMSPETLDNSKARLRANIAAARTESVAERQKISELLSGTASKLEASSSEGAGESAAGQPGSLTGEAGYAGGTAYAPDPLTGLPARAYAEIELSRALNESDDRYAALFIVKRLALINAKFGYKRGDQVLLKVVTHLTQSLPEFNKLFRWAPCAFLTLAPPKTTYKEMRAKLQIVELTRLAPTLEWEGRSAMIPVALDCRVISIKDFGNPSDLFLRLDSLATDG